MSDNSTATSEIIIDLSAIAHNTELLKDIAHPAQMMAIVKADAYNHGMKQVVSTVLDHGADQLGVATIEEALEVSQYLSVIDRQSTPINCWLWYPQQDLTAVQKSGIILGIPSLEHLRSAVEQSHKNIHQGLKPLSVTLMVDTGLSRSGISSDQWTEAVSYLHENLDAVHLTGCSTHLSAAEDTDDPLNDIQAQRFTEGLNSLEEVGIASPLNHMANTAATIARPEMRHELVRPGVGIYGALPANAERSVIDLRPSMTFRARVITVKQVPRGEGVGYNHIWRAPQDTWTAVVAAGYADGVPRSASGKMLITVGGVEYSQIGRVSMDQIVIDLGPVSAGTPQVTPGDWAIIFGQGGQSVEYLAECAGTIDYEIFTMPRMRASKTFHYESSSADRDDVHEQG